MTPLPLSVAIITQNEEANLPRLLESLRGVAAEMVVVDSGSTDRTEAIARAAGAVFQFAPWSGFTDQKNRSMELCTQPWVLFLDADEALSPELAEALRRLLGGEAGEVGGGKTAAEPVADGYWISRRTWYLGAWIWHAWYPEWRLRLVRRNTAVWGGREPHSALQMTAPRAATARLPGDLLHYSFRDLDDHLRRTVGYARTSARVYAAAGRKFGWRRLLLFPLWDAAKTLFVKGGWRDGWRGWLIAGVRLVDCWSKYAFLLELERTGEPPKPAGTERKE